MPWSRPGLLVVLQTTLWLFLGTRKVRHYFNFQPDKFVLYPPPTWLHYYSFQRFLFLNQDHTMNINLFLLLLCDRSSKEKTKFTVGWNIRDNLLYSFSFDRIWIFWIFLFFSVDLRKNFTFETSRKWISLWNSCWIAKAVHQCRSLSLCVNVLPSPSFHSQMGAKLRTGV